MAGALRWGSWLVSGAAAIAVASSQIDASSARSHSTANSGSTINSTSSSSASSSHSLESSLQREAEDAQGLRAAGATTRQLPVASDRSSEASALQLLQVHVVFRHGDRSPVPLASLSPSFASTWEQRLQPRPSPSLLPLRSHTRGIDYPLGQLTRRGAQQAWSLGGRLHQRYGEKLQLLRAAGEGGEEEGSNEIRPAVERIIVRSTDFPRTYMSAFFVLSGLLLSEHAAAAVPISIREPSEENLYENDACAKGALLWSRAWKQRSSPQPAADGSLVDVGWRRERQALKASLQAAFSLPADAKFPWVLAIDNVDCMRHHGDPLPEGVTAEAIDDIRQLLAHDYCHVFSQRDIARLAMGPLVHELRTKMQQCIREEEKQRCIFLYSGHDATLMPLAASLGHPYPTWPSYSSSLTMELWGSNDRKRHFVRILFDDDEIALPVCTPPPGYSWTDAGPWNEKGSTLSTWDEFCRISSWCEISDEEFANECKLVSHL